MDSWYQYRRGLRPEDRPFYDGSCDAGIKIMDDEFLKTRLLASEGLFMGVGLQRQTKLNELDARVRALENKMMQKN
ncbi:MAG: hypothetical protein ACTSVL_12425 [Promethearchaeota archaeon]